MRNFFFILIFVYLQKYKIMDIQVERRGRPKKTVISRIIDMNDIILQRGSDLKFDPKLFIPMKVGTEIDIILSTEGGLMPGTNLILAGGAGSGKTTVALDILSSLTNQGYKTLFVSGEMDEIAYFKYCKRIKKFDCVQVLFLKNYQENAKEVLEGVFDLGYDVIVIDSIAEVLDMMKDNYSMSYGEAELWFLSLQSRVKMGQNALNYYTSFLNIQQVTKGGDFVGSNRLKHMTEGMAHIQRSKDDLQRSIHFSKNRDCDKDFKMYFAINDNGVFYTYE